MTAEVTAIRSPVRVRVVLRYLGELWLVLAALTLVPLVVALFDGDLRMGGWLAGAVVALAVPGVVLRRVRGVPPDVLVSEALVVTALAFLAAAVVMTLPMAAHGLPLVDAMFESVSGVTTTGLSTLPTVEGVPASFLFARAWMQWYGGLGIVVLTLALILRPGRAARELGAVEADRPDLVGSTRAHARRVAVVYAVITLAGIAALWSAGAGVFDGVVYTLSAVSTGGFAPHDDSLAGLPLAAAVVVVVLCIACAVPLWRYAAPGRWRETLLDPQVWGLPAAIVVVGGVLLACLAAAGGLPWDEAWFHAPMLAASAQTTAGFSTLDVASLAPVSKVVLILSMTAGGGVGSTAGGIKLLRLLVVARVLVFAIRRTGLPPHAVARPTLAGRELEAAQIEDAWLVIGLFLAVIVVSWLAFVAAGCDPLDSLFEVVSATGTVGLSSGLTGPELPWGLKLVLCADMLLGRLEVMAWLVLLYPRTWIGRRS